MKDKIRSIPLEYGDAIFRMFYIQLMKRALENTPDKHTHGYYELHFAKKGSYEYVLEDRAVTLREGQLLIIPPDASHRPVSFAASKGKEIGYEGTVLEFSLSRGQGGRSFFDAFSQALERSSCVPITVSANLLQAANSLKETTFENVLRGYCQFKARAGEFLYLLFDELETFDAPNSCGDGVTDRDDNLILLENLINQSGSTLKEIAEAMYYSERHTSRLIRNIYGVSFSELKKQRKSQK